MDGAAPYINQWGHVVCAALFGALAIWIGRRRDRAVADKLLVAALSLTAAWALATGFSGRVQLEILLIESLRNCAFVTCLFALMPHRPRDGARRPRTAVAVYAALVITLIAQSVTDMLWAGGGNTPVSAVAREGGWFLRMIWAIGALLLIERLSASTDSAHRNPAAPVMAAMAAMWTYDLLLYSAAWLGLGWAGMVHALRGVAMIALVPAIALGVRTSGPATIQPSRMLAERSIGLLAVAAVSLAVLAGVAFVDLIPSPLLRLGASGMIFALIIAALIILPSPRFRSFLKVMVAKHLFAHRYDYRAQWMGFADTIGRSSRADAPIYERVIKAMADITESPGGVLMIAQDGTLRTHSQWNWPGDLPDGAQVEGTVIARLAHDHWVIDIDRTRDVATMPLPAWITDEPAAWALVPIVHFDQMTGALLLARPRINRALDWEDFDMLRTAGRQVGSYIAEARGQADLAEARRFDEFNRRFAFIMHDIKNLVSQLSLVARNAARHADNPDFRADMILTLEDSVGKMNDLLARLSQHNSMSPRAPVPVALGDVARGIAAARARTHRILVEGDSDVLACADPARVEQIAQHLVQNAIDATPDDSAVILRIGSADGMALLHIIDSGCGMSGDFIRNDLFRPFASTKSGGFGIGAFEARELARAMRGTLHVASVPGKGSHFTLALPSAEPIRPTLPTTTQERAA